MLRFFEENYICHIIIDSSFEESDIKSLEGLFNKEYAEWLVEFNAIYAVDAAVIQLLYNEIFIKKKEIVLKAHKERLSYYLHKLGFATNAFMQEKKHIVDAQSIEIVLVGGSADSSEKILEIVQHTSLENLSLVIIQHQQSEGVSKFDTVLQAYTNYKVSYAKDFQTIKKGHIYIAPQNKHLLVEDGHFVLSDAPKYNFAKPSLSLSYASFSHYYKKSLLVIQECGYLNDGVDKLTMLRENGSNIILQEKSECEANAMVLNALHEGVYDYVLKLKGILSYINFLDKKHTENECLQYLLEEIQKIYGYDFRYYHHEMLERRLQAFMIKNRISSIKNGIGAILFNTIEFKKLLLELSINVTEFFRNPHIYKELQAILTSSYKHRKNLKLWSAGCSSGKEAVSLAIILDSVQKLDKSIIYATDFNKTVVAEAKNGLYSLEALQKAEENLKTSTLSLSLEHYFSKNAHFVSIQQFIKEKILYFEHNLATDSSFNEFDIIVCSNVLIYFEEALQKRVIDLFYDSLKFGGYLILGERELLHRDFNAKFERYKQTQIYKKLA